MEVLQLDWLRLRIEPEQLESEFWSTSTALRDYFESIDRWSWLSVIVVALFHSRMTFWTADCGVFKLYGYGTILLSVAAQRLFLLWRPRLYWRHRSSIIHFHLAWRPLLHTICIINGTEACHHLAKQLLTKPPWMVASIFWITVGALPGTKPANPTRLAQQLNN